MYKQKRGHKAAGTRCVTGLLKLMAFSLSDILWPFQGEDEHTWNHLCTTFRILIGSLCKIPFSFSFFRKVRIKTFAFVLFMYNNIFLLELKQRRWIVCTANTRSIKRNMGDWLHTTHYTFTNYQHFYWCKVLTYKVFLRQTVWRHAKQKYKTKIGIEENFVCFLLVLLFNRLLDSYLARANQSTWLVELRYTHHQHTLILIKYVILSKR